MVEVSYLCQVQFVVEYHLAILQTQIIHEKITKSKELRPKPRPNGEIGSSWQFLTLAYRVLPKYQVNWRIFDRGSFEFVFCNL